MPIHDVLSDGGLVALAHARRASKNADASGNRPRFDSTQPANTSTNVPKAPPQSMSEKLKKYAEDVKRARRDEQMRLHAQRMRELARYQ